MASPSSSDVANLQLDDPRVAYDNAIAARSWKLVSCILSERSSTMARHTHTSPNALAPMPSKDEKQVKSSEGFFKESWQAYAEARSIGYKHVQDLVFDSCLNNRPMEDTSRLLRANG